MREIDNIWKRIGYGSAEDDILRVRGYPIFSGDIYAARVLFRKCEERSDGYATASFGDIKRVRLSKANK